MGWFWGSSQSAQSTDRRTTPSGPEAALAASQPTPSHALSSTSPPALTREQQADREFESLLASLDSSAQPTSHNDSPPPAQKSTLDPTPDPAPAATSTTPSGTIIPQPTTLDISPAALFPRSMSCRQAFDSAFYCQSFGGKFNDIYRFGALQSCGEHWDAFWFCMRVKGYGDAEKQAEIARHYEAREARKKRAVGSSEAVWELRRTPVQRAFWRDPDAVEGSGAGEG